MARWILAVTAFFLAPGLVAQDGPTARAFCDPADPQNGCPGPDCKCTEDVLAIRFDLSGGPILEVDDDPGLRIEAAVVLETIETAAAVTLMTVLMGATSMVLLQSQRLFATVTRQYTQQQTGHRVLDRLTEELRGAQPSSILPLIVSGSSYVQFKKVTGFSGGAATVGPQITLGFQLASGETLDGLDNNGDGSRTRA